MTSLRSFFSALVVSLLAACSSSHPGLPGTGDAGPVPLPDDGGPVPVPDDAGAPRVDCSARELVRAPEVQLVRTVVGDDGRLAITWARSWLTETTYETRSFLEVVGDLGASEVVAREIPGAMIAPITDGYAVPAGYPLALVHVLDLEGAVARAPIAMPEAWRVENERVAASGRTLRGEAWLATDAGVERLTFELAIDAREAVAQRIGDAMEGTVARRFDRELVRVGWDPVSVVERALPGGATGPDIAWPEDVQPVAAQLDAERDRWLVLGEQRFYVDGGFAGTRPAIVSVPRGGGSAQVTSVEVEHGMRTVTGALAIGPDAALFVVDDFHGTSFALRVDLDTLAVTERVEVDGMWRGLVAWHEPSESFALVTQTSPYDDTTAVTFRCGL